MTGMGMNDKFNDAMSESSASPHPHSPSGTQQGITATLSLASLHDPLLPLKTTRTKFSFDLGIFTCKVEDHEHNVFDVKDRKAHV